MSFILLDKKMENFGTMNPSNKNNITIYLLLIVYSDN